MLDDLREFDEETKRIIAEADAIRANGLQTRADIAKFASLMFKAGYADCQFAVTRLLKLAAFKGEPQ